MITKGFRINSKVIQYNIESTWNCIELMLQVSPIPNLTSSKLVYGWSHVPASLRGWLWGDSRAIALQPATLSGSPPADLKNPLQGHQYVVHDG